jgi:hypothetical protein
MFDTGQPIVKSNRTTIGVVLAIVLVILVGATWYYTHT